MRPYVEDDLQELRAQPLSSFFTKQYIMVHSEIRNINIIWLKRLIMVLCQIGLMGSISILAHKPMY